MPTFPKYESYKDSEIEWLGEIPSHWKVWRSKRLFSQRKEHAQPDDIQLSATQAYGVIPQEEYEERVGRKVTKVFQHLEKRRHVEVGDFVISMRSFQGGLERAWAKGCIRSSYVVLKPSKKVDIDFFSYVFKSNPYISALQSTAIFIRDGQDLNFNNFCVVDLALPPFEEQKRIAQFLDRTTTEINRAISQKQRLIELLQEQKAILINQAVTKGLNPNVPMRDSRIDAIGEIPAHWKSKRLKFTVKNIYDCKNRTPEYFEDGQYFVIRTSNVRNGKLSTEDGFYTDRKNFIEWTQKGKPLPGELVFTREAPAQG